LLLVLSGLLKIADETRSILAGKAIQLDTVCVYSHPAKLLN
jgi:hypothetical protein